MFVIPEASHRAPAACGMATHEQTQILTHATFELNAQQPNNATIACLEMKCPLTPGYPYQLSVIGCTLISET